MGLLGGSEEGGVAGLAVGVEVELERALEQCWVLYTQK